MSKDSPEWFLSWSLAYLYPAKSEIYKKRIFKKDKRSEEQLILLSAIYRMKQRIFYLFNKQLRQYYRCKNEIKS